MAFLLLWWEYNLKVFYAANNQISSMDKCPSLLCFSIFITTSALDCWKNSVPNTLPHDASVLSEWMDGTTKAATWSICAVIRGAMSITRHSEITHSHSLHYGSTNVILIICTKRLLKIPNVLNIRQKINHHRFFPYREIESWVYWFPQLNVHGRHVLVLYCVRYLYGVQALFDRA